MFYFTFAILLFAVILKNKIPKKFRYALVLAPLILIIIFRYGTGADYFAYQHIYERIEVASFADLMKYYVDIEIGYKILMWPFRLMNIPFHVFFVIINSVTLLLIIKWIEDNSVSFELSVLLLYSMFYFVWVLSAARQGLIIGVSLYYLFNKKINLQLKNKLLTIILLSLIHKSALILFLYLLLDKVKWKKSYHIGFMLFAILVSFLPLSSILQNFYQIPFLEKIVSNYLSSDVNPLDFPGLMRLFFFISFFLVYDLLAGKDKQSLDRLLYGFSLYFLLKFSEITASRLSIFGFMMMLVLVPQLIQLLNQKKQLRLISMVAVVLFSTVFFIKEVNVLQSQSAYVNPTRFVKMHTIFNSNFSDFYTIESFALNLDYRVEELKKEYLDKEKSTTSYNESLKYLFVKEGHRNYKIIDEQGDYLDTDSFKKEFYLVDGIVVQDTFLKHHFFANPLLVDLSGKNRSIEDMESIVQESLTNDTLSSHKETKVEVGVEDIPSSILKYYANVDEISGVWMSSFTQPFNYYLMRVDYLGYNTYIYFNEDKELLMDYILMSPKPFDRSNTIKVGVFAEYFIVNKNGDIIWWEK